MFAKPPALDAPMGSAVGAPPHHRGLEARLPCGCASAGVANAARRRGRALLGVLRRVGRRGGRGAPRAAHGNNKIKYNTNISIGLPGFKSYMHSHQQMMWVKVL